MRRLDSTTKPDGGKRTWPKVIGAGVLGFILGAAGCSGGEQTAQPATPVSTATVTQEVTPPAQTVTAPVETVTETETATETITATETVEAAPVPFSGGGGGGSDAGSDSGSNSGPFANCSEARAAGAAPLYRGDPGYAPKLDGDGDGVACE